MKIGDKIVIVIILISLIGVGFFYLREANSGQKNVEIWQDGELYASYSMDKEPKEIKIEHGNKCNIIVIEKEVVYMKEANCSTQQCVQQGKISVDNQSIVCLPHKLLVKITSQSNSEVDFIVK